MLRDCFKVECEFFVLLLNCCWFMYYSKYGDVDKFFGLLGDFCVCKFLGGAFEVNFSFDEDVVVRMVEYLFECLDVVFFVLIFVVVILYWFNCLCWEKMRCLKFCFRVEVISVREYGYYEGA